MYAADEGTRRASCHTIRVRPQYPDLSVERIVKKYVAVTAILLLASGHSAAAQVQWTDSFAEALQEAKARDTSVLIYFWAAWCTPCKTMDEDVFRHPRLGPAVARYAAYSADMDADDGAVLKERYGVRAVPTFVFVDPATEQEIGRVSGTRDEHDYLIAIETQGRDDPGGAKIRKMLDQQKARERMAQDTTQVQDRP